ncbi:MAG: hypothetical protein KC449_29755 [Anaerolineales bacterium]|nr:hypothetical protein [Anaerolineales bacterium]
MKNSKKAERGEIELFFVDETTLRLLCTLVKCWMKRGKQKRIATPGKQKLHHLIGAYNWRTGEIIYLFCEQMYLTTTIRLFRVLRENGRFRAMKR